MTATTRIQLLIKRKINKKDIPNILTLSRIPLALFTFLFLSLDFYKSAFFFFALACISDFLDGYLARKWSVVSNFGKTWDPVLDKFLILGSIIILLIKNIIWWPIAAILISRDIVMDFLRFFYLKTKNIVIPATSIAKAKTIFQMIGVVFLILAHSPLGSSWTPGSAIPHLFLGIAVVASLYSFGKYLIQLWEKQ